MKIKLLSGLLAVFFAASALCSCSNEQATTQPDSTTNSTIENGESNPIPAYPIIDVESMEELLSELKTSEAAIAETINSNGTLYFPEIIDKSYSLYNIKGVSPWVMEYYFEKFDETTEKYEAIYVGINYKKQTLDDVLAQKGDSEHEMISEDSFRLKGTLTIYFAYCDNVHEFIVTDESAKNQNWQKFFEIKSMDITE